MYLAKIEQLFDRAERMQVRFRLHFDWPAHEIEQRIEASFVLSLMIDRLHELRAKWCDLCMDKKAFPDYEALIEWDKSEQETLVQIFDFPARKKRLLEQKQTLETVLNKMERDYHRLAATGESRNYVAGQTVA